MSNNKDGSIAPKERINIRYVPKTDGQVAEVELPLNLLVTGDLSGKPDQTPLDERQPVAIDKNNFNAVIAQSDVGRNFTVSSALSGNDGARMDINLKVNSMADLSPDSIASQVLKNVIIGKSWITCARWGNCWQRINLIWLVSSAKKKETLMLNA
jgi:type VI secretion system protein ImpB